MNTKKRTTFSTKELATISIFTAMTAVLAQIAIPLPFTPVPISFGVVALLISGILLKPKHAVYAQICYLALGAVGAPVFGNFNGGIGVLFGPTGGYLLTYPLAAWIVAMSLNTQKSRQLEHTQHKGFILLKSSISMVIAITILYLGGTIWLSFITGNTLYASLVLAVFPFIPLDILKIIFCVFVIVPFRFRLLSMGMLMIDDHKTAGVTEKKDLAWHEAK